jgi:hypothetical protein
MKFTALGTLVLAGVLIWSGPAVAHHSTAYYFDVNKEITLEGEITRLEWVNPHILLFIQSKNAKGEPEVWILEGLGPGPAGASGLEKERLQQGTLISARAYPPREGLVLNRVTVVRETTGGPSSPRIAEAGEIRFPNGDVRVFGRGPKFNSPR